MVYLSASMEARDSELRLSFRKMTLALLLA